MCINIAQSQFDCKEDLQMISKSNGIGDPKKDNIHIVPMNHDRSIYYSIIYLNLELYI